MSMCKHSLPLSSCEDCRIEALDVAQKVYQALDEEEFYGPYVLRLELWEEFDAMFCRK